MIFIVRSHGTFGFCIHGSHSIRVCEENTATQFPAPPMHTQTQTKVCSDVGCYPCSNVPIYILVLIVLKAFDIAALCSGELWTPSADADIFVRVSSETG